MTSYIADTEAEGVTVIDLPWPPASLSGHNNGNPHAKAPIIAKHREWARRATLAKRPQVAAEGDIRLHITFTPPDQRSDRTNCWNRCKAYIDGIAAGLGINDRRFLPSMSFERPEKPGKVEVTLG